jgi:hypothetical protein
MKGFTHESTYNESKEWYTPKPIFDALGIEFDMDVCSPGADIATWIPAKKHLTMVDDGLSCDWKGCVWMNPPYGNDTPRWMRKLARHGNGIALVFARTGAAWFQEYAPKADALCFIASRIKFIPAKDAIDYSAGIDIRRGACGADSVLMAWGGAMEAIKKCGLGWMVLNSQSTGTITGRE